MTFLGALSVCRVFQQVDSAVVCLLQQPQAKPYVQSRSWEPFSRCCKCHVSLQRSNMPTRHSSFPSFLQYTDISEACWAVRKLSFINQAHVLLGFTGLLLCGCHSCDKYNERQWWWACCNSPGPADRNGDSTDAAVGSSIANLRCMEGEDLPQSDSSYTPTDLPPVDPSNPAEPYLAPRYSSPILSTEVVQKFIIGPDAHFSPWSRSQLRSVSFVLTAWCWVQLSRTG